jgi:hypothetical protein
MQPLKPVGPALKPVGPARKPVGPMQAVQAGRRVARSQKNLHSARNLSPRQFWAQHKEAPVQEEQRRDEQAGPRTPQYKGWRPGDTPRPEVKADPNELSVQLGLF